MKRYTEDDGNAIIYKGYKALAHNVLVAYKLVIIKLKSDYTASSWRGDWAAYCAGVTGVNHDNEFEKVIEQGTKLPERVGRFFFEGLINYYCKDEGHETPVPWRR